MEHYVLGADLAPLQADSTSAAVYLSIFRRFRKIAKSDY